MKIRIGNPEKVIDTNYLAAFLPQVRPGVYQVSFNMLRPDVVNTICESLPDRFREAINKREIEGTDVATLMIQWSLDKPSTRRVLSNAQSLFRHRLTRFEAGRPLQTQKPERAKNSSLPVEKPEFEEVYETYRERIYNHVYRLVGSKEEAFDLTHEAFLRAYKKYDSLENRNISSWLYTIATHLALDILRRRGLINWTNVDEPVIANNLLSSSEDDPEERAIQREKSELVHNTLTQLSLKQRMVIILAKCNGLTYVDIGNMLNISESATKSTAHKAHRQFRTIYQRLSQEKAV